MLFNVFQSQGSKIGLLPAQIRQSTGFSIELTVSDEEHISCNCNFSVGFLIFLFPYYQLTDFIYMKGCIV